MKIAIGVTAGISLYKVLNVVRALVKNGHQVKVVMTENAAKLVSPFLFQTLSGNKTFMKDFDSAEPLAHIRIGDWADVFAVVPATANTIAKIAYGMADNLLLSTLLACDKKKIVFPAMNVKMFENQATQENIRILKSRGYEVVDPCYGDLACGYKGRGRLPAEDLIVGMIEREVESPLHGKRFLVTAGGTVEKIDPVRYISNFSSGKMGIEIAKALFRKGADVLLVCGNVSVPVPSYLPVLKAASTEDMLAAIMNNLKEADGLYMAAAPADFRSETLPDQKIKKQEVLNLKLVKNPDILKEVSKYFPDKLSVGFALETEDFQENALLKLREKALDYIVLNKISEGFSPLGSDTNSVTLYSEKEGKLEIKELKDKPKNEVALWLIEETLSGVMW